MSTDFAALDALYPLPSQELFRQWVLTRDPGTVPAEWNQRTLNGWQLGFHADAHVCDLCASDGTLIGWVIEPLVYLGAEGAMIPTGSLTLPVDAHADPAAVERALYGRDERGRSSGEGLEGMWVAVVFGGPESAPFQRVYLGAIHSIVYSVEDRAVATTHNLIANPRRDEALSRAFDPLATRSYFTFGLTAFAGICRLLPNHYLDLCTFEPVRHWPVDVLEPLQEGAEGAAAIVEHARRLLTALAVTYDSYRVFLSAGRDSRAILAVIRPFVEDGTADVLLDTTVGPDRDARIDLYAARRLARIAGLPHAVAPRQSHRSDTAGVMRAFARIGEAKASPILSAPQLENRQPQDSRFVLAGMAGETGRAFFWHSRTATGKVTPEEIAKLTRSPVTETVTAAASSWLEELPGGIRASVTTTLDLAYVEQRLGCWDSPTRYLFPGRPRVTSPMAAAFNIQTMLRLPEDYRAAQVLQRDMVAYGWPDLLTIPFNKPFGLLPVQLFAHRVRGGIRRRLSTYTGLVK